MKEELKDIFVDMTDYQKTEGVLATSEGYRCVVGAMAWEEGVPHDWLFQHADNVNRLEEGWGRTLPFLKALADQVPKEMTSYLYEPFDAMVSDMKVAEMNERNGCHELARNIYLYDVPIHTDALLERARGLGYNIILACPVKVCGTKQPQPTQKENEPCLAKN